MHDCKVFQVHPLKRIIFSEGTYLAPISGTIAVSFPIKNVFWRTTINRVTGQIRAKPPCGAVIKEALCDLKAFPFVARVTLVRQFRVQIKEHLQQLGFLKPSPYFS